MTKICHVQAEQITPAELRFELQRLHAAVLTQSYTGHARQHVSHVQAEQITPAELRFELQRLHTAVLTQSALQSFLDADLTADFAELHWL